MLRVLVTGHHGYIGSVMAPYLVSAGHDVVGLDSFLFKGCDFLPDGPDIPSVRKDVRDVVSADLDGFDAVVHLAALCNDPLGDLNQTWTYDINQHASLHLAELAKAAGVERFVYASSCSMYGTGSPDEILDEEAPLNPLTAYAISKVRTEAELSRLAGDRFSPVLIGNARP